MKRFMVRVSDAKDRFITRECDTRVEVQTCLNSFPEHRELHGKVVLTMGGGIVGFIKGGCTGWLLKNRMTGEIITAGMSITQPGNPDGDQAWVDSTSGKQIHINDMEEFVHRE